MSELKELAKQIQDYYIPGLAYPAKVSELLDLIDSAIAIRPSEIEDLGMAKLKIVNRGAGTFYFIPDAQPTLREAAQAVINNWKSPKVTEAQNKEISIFLAALEAALEREE